jgi:hypothetical protein
MKAAGSLEVEGGKTHLKQCLIGFNIRDESLLVVVWIKLVLLSERINLAYWTLQYRPIR